ncbi:MAG: ABC-2 transporter permease [Ruminococcus sp.]|nr:ABC-2 transporter permease [Ruminococcus sp.]MDE7138022.1 ABC-2 transporter permease [Ruminococcus sp.]
MGGLIYKDFIVNRKSIFIALGSVLYCGIMIIIPNIIDSVEEDIGMFLSLYGLLMFFTIFLISGAFQGNMLKGDESKRWAYFITSTPMMKKHIEAKYWFIMIISLSTVFITAIFDAVSIFFNAESLQVFIMISFYIQLLMRAVEIPFCVRFGTSMGGYYRLGIFVLLLLVIGIYLLFGDLSHFGSMDAFYEWVFKALNGSIRTLQIFIAVTPFISTGMYYLSYKISCRLYLKGVENFEE